MATIDFKNNAVGYLLTAISASDVGIVLQAGNGASFPVLTSGEYFYATISSTAGTYEIVKVTARSIDSLAVTRAQEGTSASSFAAGAKLEIRITAQTIYDAVNSSDQPADWGFIV